MDYSNLSDEQINLRVFEKAFGKLGTDKDMERIWSQGKFQPCNNPADAWPIIVENGITLAFQDGNWWADNLAYWVDGVEWSIGGIIDKNPLRAAMIVFLMMQDAQ